MLLACELQARLLSDNLLSSPRSVQRCCVVGLAPGEESCNCRQQIGQWAICLLKTLSRRWIHLNQDVDCGSLEEDIENVDVVVFPFGPPLSQVQKLNGEECTVGRQINCSGEVTQEMSAFPSVEPLQC